MFGFKLDKQKHDDRPARPSMDQTLKKQMTQTMMLAGDFLTASKKWA